jgi:glycosyltransferase involved in cell wall biosynthesis
MYFKYNATSLFLPRIKAQSMPETNTKFKLAVDITFLQDQYASRGIGRYGKEIVMRLVQQANPRNQLELHLIGFGELEANLQLLEVETNPNLVFHSLGQVELSRPAANINLYFNSIRPLVKKIQPDVYYAVHFDRGLPSDIVPTVVTIHDVIPLATGKFSSQGAVMNFAKGLFYKLMWQRVRDAKLVLTSSNFSKQDLIKYGKLKAERIKVVYLGIAEYFKRENISKQQKEIDAVLGKYGLLDAKSDTSPYMIYDSGLEQNKNISALLEIFSKLASRSQDLKLVMIGGDFVWENGSYRAVNERSREVLERAARLGVAERIVPTGKVSEQELVILLSEAKQYINMSGYEGFGFGPLQAMAAGVPVIVSNKGSFPEIVGQAAIVVDPNESTKAASQIIEALSNEQTIKELISQGYTHAAKFNWDETFNQVWESIVNLNK